MLQSNKLFPLSSYFARCLRIERYVEMPSRFCFDTYENNRTIILYILHNER
ncbi:Uncharacterised protein [Porphyromonas macacae]|uniref:Uncharacterized protein n=1 Tax=Porphyromonas macacae TaxID=28115 RepID=A0A379DG95_9PORP|nr:Uncharacterised protein [Porphyromonas macacae]